MAHFNVDLIRNQNQKDLIYLRGKFCLYEAFSQLSRNEQLKVYAQYK